MSNMGYCRFENTSSDLEDCIEALEMREADLSDSEFRAAVAMFDRIAGFVADEGLGRVDMDAVRAFLSQQRDSGSLLPFSEDDDE